MSVDELWTDRTQIGYRRQNAEMLKQFPIDPAEYAFASQEDSLGAKIGQAVVTGAPNPQGVEAFEPDIKTPEKMQFRARDQAIAIDENGLTIGRTGQPCRHFMRGFFLLIT